MSTLPLVVWDEIVAQPEAWRHSLKRWPEVVALAAQWREQDVGKTAWCLVGEGSSFNAGRLALELWRQLGVQERLRSVRPWELELGLREEPERWLTSGLGWLAVSQSGKTGSLLQAWGALRAGLGVSATGLLPGVLVSNNTAPVDGLCSEGLCLNLPEERAIAATKTMTSTVLVLCLLGFAWSGKPVEGFIEAWLRLADAVEGWLAEAGLAQAMEPLSMAVVGGEKQHPALVVLSAGAVLRVLPEVALKLQETTRQPVLYYHTETFKHGPCAILGSGLLGGGRPAGVEVTAPSVLYIVPADVTGAEVVYRDAAVHFAPYEGLSREQGKPGRLWLRFKSSPALPPAWAAEPCYEIPLMPESWLQESILALVAVQLLGLQVATALGLTSEGLKKAVE